jgi:conserved membrane protein (rhomboid family)
MNQEIKIDDKNILVMKLLHYFITEKNYTPIILQGVNDEIWLENMSEDYRIVRIVSGYIHNEEQFAFDIFKTKRIVKKIKAKTLSFKVNTLSIFLDLGDNVDKENKDNHNLIIDAKTEEDIKENKLLKDIFPDLENKMKYEEDGFELFAKITNDINKHNEEDATKIEKVFSSKKPYITYFIMTICILLYILPKLLGNYDQIIYDYGLIGEAVKNGDFFRLITSEFLHASAVHLLVNMYSLYIIGTQIESFLGKKKYILIYLMSAVFASLLSITLGDLTSISIGASGAIFGLLGSLLYFGYHYRVYLGNVIKSQIIPIIVLNLIIGFSIQGIDNFAHIGGLVGGVLVTKALGVDEKSSLADKINGYILMSIFLIFLIYVFFFYR